ncbi:MAG: ribonuclease, partial [Gaiellaceae bacterium]|nr:ribonuclease [Gaiellaceae bacterium]
MLPHALAETITHSPTTDSEEAAAIRADALRAEAWAGEPFLRCDEDPDAVLAPGTARRRALDDALAEIEAGRAEPSAHWKVLYALLLGLERVLSEKPPHLASGIELRRHQIDALAGMLTELIAAAQKPANGNGHGDEPEEDEEPEDELGGVEGGEDEEPEEPVIDDEG